MDTEEEIIKLVRLIGAGQLRQGEERFEMIERTALVAGDAFNR